jgi:dihydroorotate dehydrogenase (NAD+) catalytic subunit
MSKRDLYFSKQLMNAAGTLGLAPDPRTPVPWDELGAFVTNPISLRPRKPAADPELLPTPGGFLLHTGLPNPGLDTVMKKFSRRWNDASLPVIVHLMADRPEETARMVQRLEAVENVMAAELGFAPLLADDIILLTVELCLGELPLIVSLPREQVLRLGPRVVALGAQAVSLSAPRGMSLDSQREPVTGRLIGPALFAESLLLTRDAARAGIPLIAAGGASSKENASAMLEAGALAVQLDSVLWKGDWAISREKS